MWYGKTRVTSYKSRVESLKARVEIQKWEFKSTSYEFKSASYEFNFTSYEFKSSSYEFKSTSYEFSFTTYEFKLRVQESFIDKTQVNSLKVFSFPKILSLKSFGNSWGKSSVQFLVIISCLTFQQFYDYGFSRKQYEWILTLKEETYIRLSYSLK